MDSPFNVTWIHGSDNCTQNTDPLVQVHHFDSDTIILRQSKCSEPGTFSNPGPSLEAPFLYLLIGTTRALLLDTGASRSAARFPIASVVDTLLLENATAKGQPVVPLLIAHSHSHGDHATGDSQFHNRASTTIIRPRLDDVKNFFGLPEWPMGTATLNLGNRILDIIPIPGHEDSHIALYDHNTRLLLTGDTLYPGLLVVNDWPVYVRSIARLKEFVQNHPVSFIVGGHIEMTKNPGEWFGLSMRFQPNEHVLQLEQKHLFELNDALVALGAHPRTDRHDDFIIFPAGQPFPPLTTDGLNGVDIDDHDVKS